MVLYVFSVYDAKAGAYLEPFFCLTRGIGQRSFVASVRQPGSNFALFAEDFTLFYLGKFHQVECRWEMLPSPEPVVNALAVRSAHENGAQAFAITGGE